MGKIIDFGQLRNEQEPALAVERTESFYSTARELSDFIAALPISREENDRLIALIIQQVQDGEQGAFFLDGLPLCCSFIRSRVCGAHSLFHLSCRQFRFFAHDPPQRLIPSEWD